MLLPHKEPVFCCGKEAGMRDFLPPALTAARRAIFVGDSLRTDGVFALRKMRIPFFHLAAEAGDIIESERYFPIQNLDSCFVGHRR